MPYILILFGSVLFISGVRNTQGTLWTLVKGDLTGQDSFLVWLAAIAVVGGIGYIPKLKPFSIAFMTLLLVVLVIKHGGVFNQLAAFVQNPETAGNEIPTQVIAPGAAGSGTGPNAGLAPIQPLQPLTPFAGQGSTL